MSKASIHLKEWHSHNTSSNHNSVQWQTTLGSNTGIQHKLKQNETVPYLDLFYTVAIASNKKKTLVMLIYPNNNEVYGNSVFVFSCMQSWLVCHIDQDGLPLLPGIRRVSHHV